MGTEMRPMGPLPTPPRSHTSTPTSRWWDLPAVLLLLAALFTASSRLVATQWTDHLDRIHTLTFLGALVGLALGQSVFSPRQATAWALVYGLFTIPWQLGLTLGQTVLWTERLISLAGRLIITIGQLERQEAVQDPLLFLSLMAGLFWALGVHAGYNLTRHARPWRATLPAGMALLIIQNYDPFVASRVWFLAGYLFFGILLLARLTYLHHYARWRQTRVPLPPYIGFDLIWVTLLITALLVPAAWTIPILADVLPSAEEAWQRVTQPWAVARDRLSKVFSPLRSTGGPTDYYAYYGERLSLGRGSELSETPIMTVDVSPGSARSIGAQLPRSYYWRARVYDSYADGQWTSTLSTTQFVTPTHSGLTFPEAEGRSTVIFDFNLFVPIATLYTAPQPLWVSRPAQADLAYNPDGSADLSALHVTPPLRPGETYQARSSISTATVAQLRAAGTDYPLWVTGRYLQIPSTVTTRTLELARQIALTQDGPYDIATAVTAYLRTYISYHETVPTPHPNQEPLDWFLFDQREGFCNYYASAEVILLRSLGVPARLAVGFAQGERQDESDTYLVRRRDAHAWPEVYFPGLGWIEFEPTVSQPLIHRPPGEGQPDTPSVGESEGYWRDREEFLGLEPYPLNESSPAAAPGFRKSTALWASFLALGLILVALVWSKRGRRAPPPLPILLEESLRRLGLEPPSALRRWAHRAALSPLERAYLELARALARLGDSPDPADTPAERAAALARLLPPAVDPAQRLLAEYYLTTYSPCPGNLYIAQQAARAIRNLSWRARIRWLTVRQR